MPRVRERPIRASRSLRATGVRTGWKTYGGGGVGAATVVGRKAVATTATGPAAGGSMTRGMRAATVVGRRTAGDGRVAGGGTAAATRGGR